MSENMINPVELYLKKYIYKKYDSISFILYKSKEISEFINLCKTYDFFTSTERMKWGSSHTFLPNLLDICRHDTQESIYEPPSPDFEGNLILNAYYSRRKNTKKFFLTWSYSSKYFTTTRKISKEEAKSYGKNIVLTIDELKDIIKKSNDIIDKNKNQKIKNLKI